MSAEVTGLPVAAVAVSFHGLVICSWTHERETANSGCTPLYNAGKRNTGCVRAADDSAIAEIINTNVSKLD